MNIFEGVLIVIYFRKQLSIFSLVATILFYLKTFFLKFLKLYTRNKKTEAILLLVREETYSIY